MHLVRRSAAGLAAALFVCLAGNHPAGAVEVGAAKSYVADTFRTAVATFSVEMPKDKRRGELRDFINKFGDLGLTSQDILGRYWTRASVEDRSRFRDTIGDYLLATWAADVETVPDDVYLEVGEAESKGERVIVHSVTNKPGDTPSNVDWLVGDRPDGTPFIADITISGVSLANTMREDFTAVLRSNGGKMDALLEVMRKKMAEPRTK
ncbi:MAG: phospholipid-binding protein MlaC [Actinomycetota bacterium]